MVDTSADGFDSQSLVVVAVLGSSRGIVVSSCCCCGCFDSVSFVGSREEGSPVVLVLLLGSGGTIDFALGCRCRRRLVVAQRA